MNHDALVQALAKCIADCVIGKNGRSEYDAARDFLDLLRESKLAVVQSNADTATCRTVASTMWKGMNQQDAEVVAADVYREMVKKENIIK